MKLLLPFDQLSPADFERLCLWLARREGFEDIEYLGETGSEQGRDLLARRADRRFTFQCKRVQRFTAANAIHEVKKIRSLPDSEQPDELIFVVTKAVSAATRRSAREAWGEAQTCQFWCGAELDERVKRYPDILTEFFDLGNALSPWLGTVGGRKAIRGTAVLAILALLVFGAVRLDVAALRRGEITLRRPPPAQSVYRVQVTVLGLDGQPTEGVSLVSSPRGQIQEGGGGWEIVIPSVLKPEDGRLTVWARKDSAFLSKEAKMVLGEDLHPTLEIQLQRHEVEVRGRVVDIDGQGITEASVAVVPYDKERVTTRAGGAFVLPAHAADGQLVRLRVEAGGYRSVEEEVLAGEIPVTVLLEKP